MGPVCSGRAGAKGFGLGGGAVEGLESWGAGLKHLGRQGRGWGRAVRDRVGKAVWGWGRGGLKGAGRWRGPVG